jgi:F-type H+-transporting ATPase subunit delta
MSTPLIPLAQRYAKALFSHAENAANPQQTKARVAEELSAITEALTQNKRLFSDLTAPLISRKKAKEIIEKWSAKAGFCKETTDGICLLAMNRRLNAIAQVSEEFSALYRASRNEALVAVNTASPLTKEQEESLSAHLSKVTGKTILLSINHRPDLLGGLVLQVGSQQIDASVAGKLARAKKAGQ